MKLSKGMMIAAVMVSLASACVTDEQPIESTEEAATTTVVLPEEEASDWRACWACGLYWEPCGSVREMIPQHRQIDDLNYYPTNCGGETWYYVRHHATGHQGWVRAAALCN